jgi:hypothetical protein
VSSCLGLPAVDDLFDDRSELRMQVCGEDAATSRTSSALKPFEAHRSASVSGVKGTETRQRSLCNEFGSQLTGIGRRSVSQSREYRSS